QNGCGLNFGGQQVIKEFGVNAVRLKAEFIIKQRPASRVDFVANDERADRTRPDRKAPSSGGWVKHNVGRLRREKLRREKGKRGRRRELLPFGLFRRAIVLSRELCS